jgi:hypothetical protein
VGEVEGEGHHSGDPHREREREGELLQLGSGSVAGAAARVADEFEGGRAQEAAGGERGRQVAVRAHKGGKREHGRVHLRGGLRVGGWVGGVLLLGGGEVGGLGRGLSGAFFIL